MRCQAAKIEALYNHLIFAEAQERLATLTGSEQAAFWREEAAGLRVAIETLEAEASK